MTLSVASSQLATLTRLRRGPGADAPAEAWGQALGTARAEALDALLRHLWGEATRAIDPGSAVLGAVGSYGRGCPALGSDIDVRLLVAPGTDGGALAEALLYPLWDAGLAVGHQVLGIDEMIELARTDLPTATALLDWRTLAGDARTAHRLGEAASARVFDRGGVERLTALLGDEVHERHARFGGSVYLLEPDVKSGEGGLRDLDVVGWLVQARRGEGGVSALVAEGLLTPSEIEPVAEAREWLARVRNLLHAAAAGRRSDRLTFELQESIALRLGYDQRAAATLAGREVDSEEHLVVAVEAFMSDHYRRAQLLARVLERALRRMVPLEPSPGSSGGEMVELVEREGLRERDGVLAFATGLDLSHDPAAALRLYDEAVRRGLPVAAVARERVAHAAQEDVFASALRASSEAAELFLGLCVEASETPQLGRTVIDELREVGLLLAMLPEFSPVVGRVHHDVYHVYTVDVHSVAALDRLKALVRGELAGQFPLACRLAAEEIEPAVLHLATLLHDVGKALGGRDHASRGAAMARPIGHRLGLSAAQTERVAQLVQLHLAMYHVATRRDLEDPAAIDDFCRDLSGREQLRELYLLTVADISTTSPTALTAWKAKLLDDLYLAADARLAGPGDEQARAAHARTAAEKQAGDSEFARAFVASMPDRYLFAWSPADVAIHVSVAEQASREGVACGLHPASTPGLTGLCVAADDRPGLLACIAASLARSRLEVHGAQLFLHPLADGRLQAVDVFWVRGAALERPDRLRETVLGHLGRQLARPLDVSVSLDDLLGPGRAPSAMLRRTPAVATEIAVDDRSSQAASIVEVVTFDRPGLLGALALAFYRLGLSISLAKINTEGTRVADVFYVTDGAGQKPELAPRKAEIEHLITSMLAALGSR